MLIDQVRTQFAQLQPADENDTPFVMGVSGGPDSFVLLHLFKELFPPERLIVAHLQHGLRPTADREARFVAETAARWGMACYVEAVDVADLARQRGWSLEEAGRHARYRFFARLANQVGATTVVVGHNADDQAETVLMHILRGSGLSGLRGMLPVSPLPGAPHLRLFRPLLEVKRADIEAYARLNDLQPVEDTSNREVTFLRNRIRHELLPLLVTYNPQVKTHLLQMATILAADEEVLLALQQESWQTIVCESRPGWLLLDRAAWVSLPLALRRRTLRQAVQQLRPSSQEIPFHALEQARLIAEKNVTGLQATLPGGVTLTVSYDHLVVSAEPGPIPTHLPQLPDHDPIPLPVPGRVPLANQWVIEAVLQERCDLQQVESNEDPWLAFVDQAKVGELSLRPRQPGERFQPLGMRGQSASLKEVMINRKIAAHLRPLWPLVADQKHLVWLVGHQIDERVRVTGATQQMIQLRCRVNFP